MEGCVDANMGGGGPTGPEAWKACNINELTDLENYDAVSGFPVYKALLCEVKKVTSGDPGSYVNSGEIEIKRGYEIGKDQKIKRIYLDNNATTPLDEEVRQLMVNLMDTYGNPSGLYQEGRAARKIMDSARRNVANLINTTARRILFTSGGSESNNFVIKGIVYGNQDPRKNHIITTAIEHPSVLNTCKWLETKGFEVTYLGVDSSGRVDINDFMAAIRPESLLATIMLANNEIGTIQPVSALASISRQHQIVFHTDAVQAIGKILVDVDELGIDFLTISGHKLHAPKGTGALYIRKENDLAPLIAGGSQESNKRAGTENLMGIAAFGKAAELALRNMKYMNIITDLRDKLQSGLCSIFPELKINGHPTFRLPNTLNVTLPEIRGESLVLSLDKRGVALSSGSACRSGSPEPSHVLRAIGLTEDEAHCSVRFSLGRQNNLYEISKTLEIISEIKNGMKDKIRFVSCR
jgi:cysteine desulfurase NifS